MPSREAPEAAIETLLERGYTACEIDFESGFWMDYPFAERLGELARENDVALSVHAPLFGFMGHVEPSGRKFTSAVGALDRSAGIAAASGAEVVVFHPGFLLERPREAAIDAVVEQLGTLRERLEGKDRAVPFGVEVMGRVRDLGSLDDVLEISRRTGWVRPVLDFAHMHATSDGATSRSSRSRRHSRPRMKSWSRGSRSTSTSRTSHSRTGTRRSTSPTAKGRCGRIRCERHSTACSGRRR
jgi:endonuclease IV